MGDKKNYKSAIINHNKLPQHWPTHAHLPQFWEQLGRAVATYSILENVIRSAIFMFTGTEPQPYDDDEKTDVVYKNWLTELEKGLIDPLYYLAIRYEKAYNGNTNITIENFEALIENIKKGAERRNILCHGAWLNSPDKEGNSVPKFVRRNPTNKKIEVLETPIGIEYLKQIQAATAELIEAVINTVTSQGLQFPGGAGLEEISEHTNDNDNII